MAAGSESPFISGFEDWLPTILEAAGCGANIPAEVDGLSLVSQITEDNAPGLPGSQRPFLYREFAGYGGQQCVLAGRWKAIRQQLRKGPAPTELYDLEADRSEAHDVAAEHPDIVKRLEALMAREHTPSRTFPIASLGDELPAR